MAYVTVINEHQHVQQVVSGHHHLTADEPVAAGGSDAGFAPRELLLASLGTCTAVALRKHAAQNDWMLGKITVGVRWSRDTEGRDHIERRLSFDQAAHRHPEGPPPRGRRGDTGDRRAARRDQDPVVGGGLKRAAGD